MSADFFIICSDPGCFTVIFHNDQFIIVIRGQIDDRFHAAAQVFHMILIRNNDRYKRPARQLVFDPEDRCKCPGALYFKIPVTQLRQMICNGSFCSIYGISLGIDGGCHASLVGSPVIQDPRNMHDMFCLCCQTQDHIMILTAVKLAAEQFFSLQQFSCEHAEMTDIIVGEQVIRCKIRLKVHRDHMIDAVSFECGFITVNIICILFADCLHISK